MASAKSDLRNEQREKRKERREKREKRREKRAERRDNNEYRPEEAARGPQMRPPRGRGGDPFLHHAATCSASSRDRGQREESREKRETSRDMRKYCLQLESLHVYRVPWPPRKVLKIRESHRNGRKTGSLHFYRARGHFDESAKNNNDLLKGSFANVLKLRGCYEECRQLRSLQFYRVPWPPRVRAKRAQKKASKLRSCFETIVRSFEFA